MKFNKLFYVLFFALFCLILSGCARTNSVASHTKSAVDQSVLKLTKPVMPASSFVNGVTIVGKTLKYKVTKVNRIDNEVSFGKQTEAAMISVRLILLQNDNQTIQIFVTANGAFDEGNQAVTAKIIDDFKTGLEKQFAQ